MERQKGLELLSALEGFDEDARGAYRVTKLSLAKLEHLCQG